METAEARLQRYRLPHSLSNSLRRKPLPALRITIPQTYPIVSQMHSNEPPPLLSKSLASISQTSLSSRPHRIPLKQTRKTKAITKQEAHPRTFDEDDSSGDNRTFSFASSSAGLLFL